MNLPCSFLVLIVLIPVLEYYSKIKCEYFQDYFLLNLRNTVP